jgi:hypothetical protein
MERRPPGEQKVIVPTKGEAAKVNDPRADEHAVMQLAKEILGAIPPKPRAAELTIRTQPVHRLAEDERKARRIKNRLKRTKPSQARSRGRGAWIGKAKEKHKAEREG